MSVMKTLATCGVLLMAATAIAQPRIVITNGDVQAAQADTTWIGVESVEVDDALRAQLGLGDKQGLLVLNLAVGSPAEKAGIQRHDVLLAAGDVKLTAVADLVQAVRLAGNEALAVKLLRGGKETTVQLKPEARPLTIAIQGGSAAVVPDQDRLVLRQLEDWLAKNPAAANAAGRPQAPMAFHLYHPGVVLPPPALEAKLPDEMTIMVTKHGNEPLKVTVRHGNRVWETTRDKLNVLPDDVRPVVATFLGVRLEAAPTVSVAPQPMPTAGPIDLGQLLERQMREANERLELQMRDLNERMKQMQKRMETPQPSPTPGGSKL